MNQPTTAQALATAQTLGLERLDAQLLLLHALGKPLDARAWLLAHDSDELADDIAQRFRLLCLRRASGEPLAYLVGSIEFFGLTLQIDTRVLIPRPDTETLVQWSLDLLQTPGLPARPDILDLGTGSGAIALAIAHSLQAAGRLGRIVAVDASAAALRVARENARRLGLHLQLIESHWLDKVDGHFDLIASNPPYIASADPHLAALTHEPPEALVAGADGLDDIRLIVRQAPRHLRPGGWLLLEHGYDQAGAVRKLLARRGFVQVQSRLDLAGIERCSGGQWPG
ncbi:MAG: peptide chain release factor N(5)-glutamine methyltransferase [Polaromonas sp.]